MTTLHGPTSASRGSSSAGRSTDSRSPLEVMRRKIFYPFVTPALILYVVFLVAPTIVSLWLSFNSWGGFGPSKWVGLRNYEALAQDPAFRSAFLNSMIILIGVGALVFVISFAITMVLREMRGRSFVRAVLFFPYIVSPIVLSIVWGFVFQHDGILEGVLGAAGINAPSLLSSANGNLLKVILVGIAWISVGLYATIILAGVDQIPGYLYEEAFLSGANAFQRFRYITLPLSWDVVSVAAVLWTVNSLKIFEFIFAFGGGTTNLPPPSVWNSALFVYGETFGGQVPSYRFGYASAAALFMLAVFAAFVVLLRRMMRRDAIEF